MTEYLKIYMARSTHEQKESFAEAILRMGALNSYFYHNKKRRNKMKVTIKNGGYEATINSVGAELTSYKTEEGKEYLWNADPAFWPRSSPLLFPSIGNVRNDKTIIGGVEYPMPKHGFCREQDFGHSLLPN
jgi:galactose mutarotase-like enzyme